MGIPPAKPHVAVSVLCDGTNIDYAVCAGCVCVGGKRGGRVFRFFTTVMAGTLSAARNESKFAQMTMTQTVQQESRVTI